MGGEKSYYFLLSTSSLFTFLIEYTCDLLFFSKRVGKKIHYKMIEFFDISNQLANRLGICNFNCNGQFFRLIVIVIANKNHK